MNQDKKTNKKQQNYEDEQGVESSSHHESYRSVDDLLMEEQHNLHDFSFEAIDLDTKFRSMNTLDYGVSSPSNSAFVEREPVYKSSTSSNKYYSATTMQSSSSVSVSASASAAPLQDVSINSKLSNFTESINVPNKPFYLGPSQFICTLSLLDLFTRLQQKLNSILEVSYMFDQDNCRWEGVYLRGSSRCKFELNLYKDSSNIFTIEGNRLSGDSVPFRNIFIEIQSSLASPSSSSTPSSGSSSSSRTVINNGISTTPQALPSSDLLPPDEAKEALQAILSMAKSNHLESKIEAVKILCDLSYQQDLHYLLCETNCIEILIEFMEIDHEYCNQYAICALANLSSSRTCQSSMMKLCNSFVPLLFNLVTDGPYHNAEMRRECARTFANLCTTHGPKIIHTVGTSCTSSWLNTVEELQDERLKLHAERAKSHLMTCF